MAHPGGRPLKFQSVKELQQKIDQYFSECDRGEETEVYDKKKQEVVKIKKTIPYTITGLALALDTCRQTILNYEVNPEFMDTIKRAKLKCENYVEKLAISASGVHPSGPIFALKNYGWTDKQEVDLGDRTIEALRNRSLTPEEEKALKDSV